MFIVYFIWNCYWIRFNWVMGDGDSEKKPEVDFGGGVRGWGVKFWWFLLIFDDFFMNFEWFLSCLEVFVDFLMNFLLFLRIPMLCLIFLIFLMIYSDFWVFGVKFWWILSDFWAFYRFSVIFCWFFNEFFCFFAYSDAFSRFLMLFSNVLVISWWFLAI